MRSGAVNHKDDCSEVPASSCDSIASWPPSASSEVSPSASPSSMTAAMPAPTAVATPPRTNHNNLLISCLLFFKVLTLDLAAAVGAAVFHADFGVDPLANGVACSASGQESEQCAGEGSDACTGCRAEYGNERADGGSRRCAGTEPGVGAACSDRSPDYGSNFFRDSVSDHEFACVAARTGWYELFHEQLLDGEKNSARLKGLALRVLFVDKNQIAGCPAMSSRCNIPNMEGASSVMLLITLLVSGRRDRMDAFAMPIP